MTPQRHYLFSLVWFGSFVGRLGYGDNAGWKIMHIFQLHDYPEYIKKQIDTQQLNSCYQLVAIT